MAISWFAVWAIEQKNCYNVLQYVSKIFTSYFLFDIIHADRHQPIVFAGMSGGVYSIDQDSINTGGNENSVSGDITISDTIGEVAVGTSSGSTYKIGAGYREVVDVSEVAIGVTVPNIILSRIWEVLPVDGRMVQRKSL